MRRIAISNGKGGVGKTTTSANLGAALAREGYRVLLVDMDPQQSLSDFFMIDTTDPDSVSIAELIMTPQLDPSAAIVNISKNLDILPGSERLAALDGALLKLQGGTLRLKRVVAKLEASYDYCIIDTPPSLSVFVQTALMAAQDLIIPLKPNDMDMKATEHFLETVDLVKEDNQDLKVSGVVFTMTKNSKTQDTFSGMFKGHELESVVMKTKIRDTVKLGVSGAKGMDIFSFDPKGIGAQDYTNLAKEVISWK
jgi:chromosome partitioning protein